jgi:hypothetical protein
MRPVDFGSVISLRSELHSLDVVGQPALETPAQGPHQVGVGLGARPTGDPQPFEQCLAG